MVINSKYAHACTEVLEIIKSLPEEELSKIPSEKIAFYEKNKDINYNFTYNEDIPFDEQNISIEALAIIITLFRDYFTTDIQKTILKNMLLRNDFDRQKALKEKYNPDNIFSNKLQKNMDEQIKNENLQLAINDNRNFFIKIITYVKKFLLRKK